MSNWYAWYPSHWQRDHANLAVRAALQLQAVFLVSDDMMDRCATRRGKPCYYRLEGVNHIAVNDSTMLEAAIFHLLRVHFRSEPYYVHLLELFHEVRL